jgi:general secretion pathway protein G
MRQDERQTERETTRAGFTLIEMLVVSGMILLLAGLLVAAGAELRKQSLIKETQSRIRALEAALENYNAEYRTLPASLSLITTVTSTDAWGNAISYTKVGTNNPGSYDLQSNGPDGTGGTADDINNWTRM